MRQQLSVISRLCLGTLLAVYQYRSSFNVSVGADRAFAAAARKKHIFAQIFESFESLTGTPLVHSLHQINLHPFPALPALASSVIQI